MRLCSGAWPERSGDLEISFTVCDSFPWISGCWISNLRCTSQHISRASVVVKQAQQTAMAQHGLFECIPVLRTYEEAFCFKAR